MDKNDWTYELEIDGVDSPRALPLSELVQYLTQFASLLGNSKGVHFADIREGCVLMQVEVEQPFQPQVLERVQRYAAQAANDPDALSGIEDLLRVHKATAVLRHKTYGEVLRFQPRDRPEKISVFESRLIDGVVIRLSGGDATAHVAVKDAKSRNYYIHASHDQVRELGMRGCLLGDPIRLQVVGTWRRENDGRWLGEGLKLEHWKPLDTTNLLEVFRGLHELPGEGWRDLADPLAAWKELRG